MPEYKPPAFPGKEIIGGKLKIFLAGSIDNGKAADWQNEMAAFLAPFDVAVFNPRRNIWEVDVMQGKQSVEFTNQVKWEIEHILAPDIVIFYILGGSLSPITLYELGLVSLLVKEKKKKAFVCCEEGFWRKGNVDVVCDVFDIETARTMDEMKEALMAIITEFTNNATSIR